MLVRLCRSGAPDLAYAIASQQADAIAGRKWDGATTTTAALSGLWGAAAHAAAPIAAPIYADLDPIPIDPHLR